jgi:hypothetical protein
MEVGFFFWPYSPDLVRRMSAAADRYALFCPFTKGLV